MLVGVGLCCGMYIICVILCFCVVCQDFFFFFTEESSCGIRRSRWCWELCMRNKYEGVCVCVYVCVCVVVCALLPVHMSCSVYTSVGVDWWQSQNVKKNTIIHQYIAYTLHRNKRNPLCLLTFTSNTRYLSL